MITYLKSAPDGVLIPAEATDCAWVKVSAPTPDEVARLQVDLQIPAAFFEHSLDMEERARVVKENGALLVVLRLPHAEGAQAAAPYTTVPVGIVITPTHLVTLCPKEGAVIQTLATGAARHLAMDNPGRFLLQLLDVMAERYLAYVREIDDAVDVLEARLRRSLRNQEVLEMLKYQKSLTYFTTGIKSNIHMLERLREENVFGQSPTDAEMLADVGIELRQAMEMIDISASILNQTMDAFASIISNNINTVMKFLASITIVLSIPTMVASVYGMNVGLPLAGNPLAFALVTGGSIIVALLVSVVFWRKDWF